MATEHLAWDMKRRCELSESLAKTNQRAADAGEVDGALAAVEGGGVLDLFRWRIRMMAVLCFLAMSSIGVRKSLTSLARDVLAWI